MIRDFGMRLLGSSAGPAPRVRWWHIVVPFVVLTLIALLRLPPAYWNVLWAEDGPIFVTDAYRGGFALLQPYAGYMHAVPRLVAGAAVTVVPVQWVPLAFTLASAAIAGGVATAVWLWARLRIRSAVVCALLALQVVVLPMAGGEVALNVANLHWYLIFGAFWAAIVTAPSRWLTVLQCVTVAAAVLSDPLAAVIVFPLIVVRVLALRPFGGRVQAVSWTFLAACLIQGPIAVWATLFAGGRTPGVTRPSVSEFAKAYSGRVVVESLLGPTGTAAAFAALGIALLVAALALVGALIVFVAWRDRERRWLILAFAAASVAFSALVLSLQWDFVHTGQPGDVSLGGRYLVVPILLLFSCYAIAADFASQRVRPRSLAWIPAAALALVVVIPGVIDYRTNNVREGTQSWQRSLEQATESCEADPNATTGSAGVAPSWFPGALVPCELLETADSP